VFDNLFNYLISELFNQRLVIIAAVEKLLVAAKNAAFTGYFPNLIRFAGKISPFAATISIFTGAIILSQYQRALYRYTNILFTRAFRLFLEEYTYIIYNKIP